MQVHSTDLPLQRKVKMTLLDFILGQKGKIWYYTCLKCKNIMDTTSGSMIE